MKRARCLALAALLQATLAAPALSDPGDDPRLSAVFHGCMEQAGGVSATMRACMNSEQDRLEAKLNQDYRDLMASMPDGDAKESLRQSERAWIAHREAQCAFEGTQQESGSLRPVLIAGCWLKETADRVEMLEQRHGFETRWHGQ